MAARLEGLLDSTEGKLHNAAKALIWRLAVHPSQSAGRMVYTELSVGYIAKAAGVGRETARTAWHMVRECLGWFRVSLDRVRSMGVVPRTLLPGGLWGQHMLLTTAASVAATEVTNGRGLGPVRHALPDGEGWLPLTPVQKGRHTMASCPWHEDETPSMILNTNEDGCSGSGVCLSCTADDGGRLRIYWRSHEGKFVARLARGIATLQTGVLGTGTIHNKGRVPGPVAGGIGHHVFGTLESGVMSKRASKCLDLIALLKRSDRDAQTDRAGYAAHEKLFTGDGPGDSYVSVDRMGVTQWRTFNARGREVSVPSRWAPIETRWVLADLDGFESAPALNEGLTTAGEAIEAWAKGHPALSGRVAVLRTSHLGVQVAVELETPEQDPRRWNRSAYAQRLMRQLDGEAMRAVKAVGFKGGHADQAVHAAGRLMRRPGWRMGKAGFLYCSRLAYSTSA